MKYLKFKSLYLISMVEQAARKFEFDPKRTLVKGANQTGKSSLLKSLYWTFGATPAVQHNRWKEARVTSIVHFEFEGVEYFIFRYGNQFILFDAKHKTIANKQGVTTGIGPVLAELFNFKLTLPSRETKEGLTPPPAYQFLPYYIDQDISWKENWAGFDGLSQFSNWRKDVAEFHLGVRPNEYYVLKAERAALQSLIDERAAELKIFESIRDRLQKTFRSTEFDINPEAFKEEIQELVKACNRLLAQENEYKEKYSELESEKAEVQEQIAFTNRVAGDLAKDYNFATHVMHEGSVPCPICGTEYENSFAQRFAIATDENNLLLLITQLKSRFAELEMRLAEVYSKFRKTESDLAEIKKILSSKREAVTLTEVLQSQGKEQAGVALKLQYDEVIALLGADTVRLKELTGSIGKLTDKSRSQAILGKYRSRMGSYLKELNVLTLAERAYAYPQNRIKETGSALPRALLAFYFSFLDTTLEFSDGTFFPIIVDSPNQQAQDHQTSLPAMLRFIRDHQPAGSQLILGLEDDLGVDIPSKQITATEKYHLLKKTEYESISKEIAPLLDSALLPF